jgi:predicted ATPase/DNA-binding CsgD family transcriptional regulator
VTGALDVRFERLRPLIGREIELATIRDRLSDARLVTLTGPGGIGKTRLALEVAADDGSVVVDLAAVSDPSLVALEVAAAIGAEADPGQSPETWIALATAEQGRLLVLDNLEQIEDGSAAVGRILLAASNVRILATSRVPLGLPGEVQVAIPPLAVPASDRPEDVLASPAGSLFLRLAHDVGRTDTLDAETIAAIGRLCRRLDGLPLALELASARLGILSPAAILRRLDAGFTDVLSRSRGSERHRSLDAVLDWSIGLLSEAHQRVLLATSVCAGGFDLPVVEALVPDEDVLGALDELVRYGLVEVRQDESDEPRFTMLETIRSAARGRVSPPEAAILQRRHAVHFRGLAHESGSNVAGSGWAHVARLDKDRDNLRAALDWAGTSDPELGLDIAARLLDYWRERGSSLPEGIDVLRRLLARADLSCPHRPDALAALGHLQFAFSGPVAAQATAEEALASALSRGDVAAEAHARTLLASIMTFRGSHDAGVSHLRRVLEIAGQLGDPYLAMQTQAGLALAAVRRDDIDEAIASYTALAEQARNSSAPDVEAVALSDLAGIHLGSGRPREALENARAARLLVDAKLPAWWLALALTNEAAAHARLDEAAQARADLLEILRIVRELPAHEIEDEVLTAACAVLIALGNRELGCRALGAAAAIRRARGAPLFPVAARSTEIDLRNARRSLDPIKVELAIRAGGEASAESTLADMEAFLEADARQQAPSERARPRHADLSPREIEVLSLLAEGRSDGEIAEALFISPKTASVHVSNVKGKLGVASRLEAALKARELGLEGRES